MRITTAESPMIPSLRGEDEGNDCVTISYTLNHSYTHTPIHCPQLEREACIKWGRRRWRSGRAGTYTDAWLRWAKNKKVGWQRLVC